MTTQTLSEWPPSCTYIERIGAESFQRPQHEYLVPLNVPLLVVSRTSDVFHLEGPDQTGYDVAWQDLSRADAFVARCIDNGGIRHRLAPLFGGQAANP